MYSSIVSMLLFKCPLKCGLVFLDTPALLGAADVLLRDQLAPVAREQLAALAASKPARLGIDDDVHLLRIALLRQQQLQSVCVWGGSCLATLDDAFIRQVRCALNNFE